MLDLDQTSSGGGGSSALSFGSVQLAYRTYSSLDGEPPRFPLLLLDVYCVDVSSSMWFSPRAGPLGIFGKSKLDTAKEIMAPSESNLRKKHEQQSQRLEKEMPHYYIAKRKICLIKFHEKVKMLVPIGDEDRQRGVFQEQLRTLKHKKHTALMAALEFCEEEIQKWIDLKLTPEEQKMEKDVILHLFTDGHDTVADKQRRAQWQSYVGEHNKKNKKNKKIYRTFLYTFSQDFTKSKDMAKWLSEIGSDTQLIVVDTAHPERAIDESWQQRDKMLFTLLRSKPSSTSHVLTRKPSKRFRIGKYNYLANVDGEHNIGLDWTLEYLKKLEIVFQQEDFYQCTNIFRSEGDISIVTEVDKEFLEGKTSLESLERPLEVASATKRILRRSEPFIPLELQPKLIELLLKPLPALEKGVAMANMMRDLPMENKQCLRILFSILHTVAANADHTQMPSGHLAIPFAPIIFKGKEMVTLSNLEQLRFQDSIHATAYLINNFPVFCNLLE